MLAQLRVALEEESQRGRLLETRNQLQNDEIAVQKEELEIYRRLDVYDVHGRLVRSLRNEIVPAGIGSTIWDGRNGEGVSVAPGVYFVAVRTADRVDTHKIVRMR